ncbi:MAG: protein kinase domain-containing protein [Gemmatirosa sp.]
MVLERLASCPACGTSVAADGRFCPTCGQRLAADPAGGTSGGPAIDPFLARVRAALIGDYEVSHEIGRGGMAAVFLAKDLRLPRRVALKVMLPELTYSTVMPQRFVGEARTAAMLDHPNIVPVFHAGEQDGLRYFAMRYIDGCSLERLQRALGPLPVTLACHLLAEIAAALDYAHAQGVVHRDVKPANVMIDRRFGRAIVTDFGIARVADGQRLTSTGLAIGTPEYMSPEQYASEDVTGASDQYALGAVAFHLLAGRPPFAGTQAEVLMAHLREPPPSLRALRPDVPEVIATIVLRMLAKSPADRWPSLGELATRFTEHVGSAALALPTQLIALLPDRNADEPTPPQTPVSPAAGLRRPDEPSSATPPETPPPVTPPSVVAAPIGLAASDAVPSLQATGNTPRGIEPADVAPREAVDVADRVAEDEAEEAQPATATISRYTPVAPAYVEPPPPPRDPARRAQRYIVGGMLTAVLAAAVYVTNRPEESDGPRGDPTAGVALASADSGAPGGATTESAAGGLGSDTVPPDDTAAPGAPGVAPGPPESPTPDAREPATDRSTRREVRITPRRSTAPLAVGDSVRLRAVMADGNGNTIATVDPVRWSSNAPTVASVSPDGWVRALAPGRPIVTARIGALSSTRSLRVTPRVVARAEPAPPPAPSSLTVEEAQRQAERLGATIAARRVDELRTLLGGPAAPALLTVLRDEEGVQAPVQITGPVQRAGDAASVPLRVDLSWQNFVGPFRTKRGRKRATLELLAHLERSGDAWRVTTVQVPSLTRH